MTCNHHSYSSETSGPHRVSPTEMEAVGYRGSLPLGAAWRRDPGDSTSRHAISSVFRRDSVSPSIVRRL